MKPIINIVYNRSIPEIDITSLNQSLQLQIENEMEDERYLSIVQSSLPLHITAIINPEGKALENAYHQNDSIYIKVDPLIEQEDGVYLLRLGLSRLSLNQSVIVLIVLGLKPITNVGTTNIPNPNEIKYKAIEPQWTFDRIILPNDVIKKLERATRIVKNRDVIFDDLGYSLVDKTLKSIICFYGPAGTGKTITAQAIAHNLNKKIVISSYAQIESKYVGEGAQNLRKIFQDAQEQDAVLFMDECDSFLSKRIEHTEGGSDKHYNRMSNELFQLLEDYSGCIIFATNLLTDIDKAFKSRIVDSIYFPLPDKECRVRMLQEMIQPQIIQSVFSTKEDIEAFAEELEGFSGRDMRKSILLTLAEVSEEYITNGKEHFVWNKDKFRVGFDAVHKSFSEDSNENAVPIDSLQDFIKQKDFNKRQFEMAKHAILVDGTIDSTEETLLQELSNQLLNVDFNRDDAQPTMTLDKICENINDINKRRVLLDTAIRVVTIDGDLSDAERTFIEKVALLLKFSNEDVQKFISYAESMANTCSIWQNALK